MVSYREIENKTWISFYIRLGRRLGAVLLSYIRLLVIKRKIALISRSDDLIVIGPWLSEVGFELLYWIPFLNWALDEYHIDRNRIVIISRGGARSWYDHLGGTYLDVFDFLSEQEFQKMNKQRIDNYGLQKQLNISDFDSMIFQMAKDALEISQASWFHPSIMYRLFGMFWWQKQPIRHIEEHTIYNRFNVPSESLVDDLPDEYVAVKIYFRNSFPDTEENQKIIRALIHNLSLKMHVVLLDTGLEIDDHKDMFISQSDRIHSIKQHMTPRNNLEIQTKVISGAQLFVGTYGGFSYLAPQFGVPSISFYSDDEGFLPLHLDVARRAFNILGSSFTVICSRDIDNVRIIFS